MKSKVLVSKNKILVSIVVLILVIVGSVAFYMQYKANNDPSKIIKDITGAKKYSTDVEITTKNSRGEFTEEAKVEHNNSETKLTFVDKEQIFLTDKIKIKYFEEDKHFTVDRDYDEFYRFFLLNELPKYINSKDATFEEADNRMVINFKGDSNNRNFTDIKFVVDLSKKEPESLRIFDDKGNERIVVNYSNFQITKE